MKKIFLALTALFLTVFMNAQTALNVMTFNIRYNNAGDSINAWPNRKDKVASQILFHHPHTLGVQEALYGQMQDLLKALPGYQYTGVGRADGKTKGEYSAIFYDTSRLQLLQSETFWLAEKTDLPGAKGWDAAIERIVTWALFRDKKTKKNFYHFNTHFDHKGKIARRESAKLLLEKVNAIAGKIPVIITGDFNATPEDEPIKVLTDKSNPKYFTDTKQVSVLPHYGPDGTFNGFTSKETRTEPIDYIFIKKGFSVLQHATLSQTWQGLFSSDHFPVMALLIFK
jgi:endonuclease/exonuclease/phosphatase family metal-dependent hydrolase